MGGTLAVGAGSAMGYGNVSLVNGTLKSTGTPITIEVNGNYTQGTNGTLQLGLAGVTVGQYDSLSVSGSATLGGTLTVVEYNNYKPIVGSVYTAVTAVDGVQGSLVLSLRTTLRE